MNQKLLAGFALSGLMASGMASAAIVTPTTFNLNNLPTNGISAINNALANGVATCTGCYDSNGALPNGIKIGLVSSASHFHTVAPGVASNKMIDTVSDSNGFYVTADDRTTFKLTSLLFDASPRNTNVIYGANPLIDPADGTLHPTGSSYDPTIDPSTGSPFGWTDATLTAAEAGPQEYWEILGFNTAVNPNLDTGDGTNYSTRVAYQTVAQGFNGLVTLNAAFSNISAFWVHYHGYAAVPTNGIAYNALVDNISLAAPAAVPVPASVWLFGSGLLGLASFGRKKAGLAA